MRLPESQVFLQTMAKKVIHETFLPRMIPDIWYTARLLAKQINSNTSHENSVSVATPHTPHYSHSVSFYSSHFIPVYSGI